VTHRVKTQLATGDLGKYYHALELQILVSGLNYLKSSPVFLEPLFDICNAPNCSRNTDHR